MTSIPLPLLGGSAFPMEPGLQEWCVLHVYRGSIAHGMYEPPENPLSIDDKDTMAICVPSVDHYYGLSEYGSRGTREIKAGEWDVVVYEARKAVRMLAGGNPNILSMLWVPEHLHIYVTPAGRYLIDQRDVFVGRHVHASFVGYAKGQFYKMTHGSKRGYMGVKRAAIVERFGFDTKNAAHLIRLLRMGIEFLRDGDMRVDRGGLDATELLDIKHGEWTLAAVQNEARRLFDRVDRVLDSSPLPARPDPERVNAVCVELVTRARATR